MKYRGDLNTEQQNKKSLEIDGMEISEILRTINNEDDSIANAVRTGLPEIEETISSVSYTHLTLPTIYSV